VAQDIHQEQAVFGGGITDGEHRRLPGFPEDVGHAEFIPQDGGSLDGGIGPFDFPLHPEGGVLEIFGQVLVGKSRSGVHQGIVHVRLVAEVLGIFLCELVEEHFRAVDHAVLSRGQYVHESPRIAEVPVAGIRAGAGDGRKVEGHDQDEGDEGGEEPPVSFSDHRRNLL